MFDFLKTGVKNQGGKLSDMSHRRAREVHDLAGDKTLMGRVFLRKSTA